MPPVRPPRSALAVPVAVVDQHQQLHQVAKELACSRFASIDLEALRPEPSRRGLPHLGKISLIQIACYHNALERPRAVHIVDVLSLGPAAVADALRRPFESQWPQKVVYDCRRDAEALVTQLGLRFPERDVIDLQLAVTALRWRRWGSPHRLTEEAALLDVCGIDPDPELAKLTEQMRDDSGEEVWARRPLPPLQQRYAAEDVVHHHVLVSNPELQGRLNEARLLAARYLQQFQRGGLVVDEPDGRAALVREDWLQEEVGPPGRCVNCGKPGHAPDACIRAAVCSHCGRSGHTEEFCFALKKAPSQAEERPQLRCAHCGQLGHTAERCFSLKPELRCEHCGQRGHIRKHCRHLHPCAKCGKRGHVASRCTAQADARLASPSLGQSGDASPRPGEPSVQELVQQMRTQAGLDDDTAGPPAAAGAARAACA